LDEDDPELWTGVLFGAKRSASKTG